LLPITPAPMTPTRSAPFGSDFDPKSLELISSTPPNQAPNTPPLSSTSSHMWRTLRRDRGHDLMQKITSANHQKRNDSNAMWKPPAFAPLPGALV
jgi:hypothetical protein